MPGRITALGDDSLRDLAGPSTPIVDIDGGLLIPGFQDAHVHPLSAGLGRLSCDLSALDNASGYLAAIGSYAAGRPTLEWVSGAGWMMAAFPGGLPRREALDSVVPDRPAYFTNRDGHGAWVNTRALELAGIDATTPEPGDGRIERDADGVATGVLHEGAMDLVVGMLPRATLDDQVEGLLEAQRQLHSLGITAWQDAIVGSYSHIPTRPRRTGRWSPLDVSPRGSSAPCGGPGAEEPSRSRSSSTGARGSPCRACRWWTRPSCAATSPSWTGSASRCTSTRSATVRSGKPSTPSRRPAPSTDPPTTAITSPTSS